MPDELERLEAWLLADPRRQVLLEVEPGKAFVEFHSPERSDPLYYNGLTLRAAIEAAIEGLKPHERLVFVLREMEGKTYEEISEITGVNLGTVKSRLNRARNNFAQVIAPYRGQARLGRGLLRLFDSEAGSGRHRRDCVRPAPGAALHAIRPSSQRRSRLPPQRSPRSTGGPGSPPRSLLLSPSPG